MRTWSEWWLHYGKCWMSSVTTILSDQILSPPVLERRKLHISVMSSTNVHLDDVLKSHAYLPTSHRLLFLLLINHNWLFSSTTPAYTFAGDHLDLSQFWDTSVRDVSQPAENAEMWRLQNRTSSKQRRRWRWASAYCSNRSQQRKEIFEHLFEATLAKPAVDSGPTTEHSHLDLAREIDRSSELYVFRITISIPFSSVEMKSNHILAQTRYWHVTVSSWYAKAVNASNSSDSSGSFQSHTPLF